MSRGTALLPLQLVAALTFQYDNGSTYLASGAFTGLAPAASHYSKRWLWCTAMLLYYRQAVHT